MLKRAWLWFMIGIAMITLMIAILFPRYIEAMVHSREETLRVNLIAMREGIKQYIHDKNRTPKSLEDLVDGGYFRQLPIDPITDSNETWKPVVETITISPRQTDHGITDVSSGSSLTSSNGTNYSNW